MEKSDFLKIAITGIDFCPGEAKRIQEILTKGEADYVHIRKPYATAKETEQLIKEIGFDLHKKLKLHDHFELLNKYDLGGVHLNSRNPIPHQKAKSISKSFHSLIEIEKAERYDYFFISPIFDSISKEGYKAAFDLKDISKFIQGKKAIALGGVTPDKIPLLKNLGFSGAAMLGYFFPPTNGNNNIKNII